ncbi:Lrp/AsnC family transcriptional regulator [Gorillibacterium timonense]|uniref:Lrp/AsnC family transcriptional regulator n=1 Tax=Gorillibacterium timonense TaxID=1689269 RepID=UPI00071CE85F|nr:Lrp/AsnC family transcriptional regulator [Gorillibacterium timonense]
MTGTDKTDLKIIDALKENGRATASEISRKVNLSVPAVSERIRKMEEAEVIENYTVKVNREKLNYKLLVFIFVIVDETDNIENFRKTVVQYPSVLECHHLAGEYDYLLKVLLEDTKALEQFISHQLRAIKGVNKINTTIALSTLKESINV